MPHTILILYGSYRADRQGIRLADYLVRAFAARGDRPELVDARAVGLPMLDRLPADLAEPLRAARPDARGRRIAAVPIESVAFAASQLLMLGDAVEVLEPKALRAEIATRARRVARLYR